MSESSDKDWSWVGANPITSCVLAFEFEKPFPQPVLSELGRLHARFRKRLPRHNVQQLVALPIGPSASVPQRRPLAGIVFDRLKGDGTPDENLGAIVSTLSYMTSAYSRWNEIWGSARVLFDIVFPPLLRDNALTGFALEFTDKFIYSGQISPSGPVRFLLKENPFMASNIFNCQDLWHSNHGYFRQPSILADSTTLENVNLSLNRDTTDDEPALRLDIVINQRVAFAAPRQLDINMPFGDSGEGSLEQQVSLVHRRNKEVLSALLLAEIVDRIPGLGSS